ncbi:MAG: hypothetical protein J5712_07490 [Lachnospiraceae bacterium]|nr:hypothetical protein [Lachnospiraceae bacterium]
MENRKKFFAGCRGGMLVLVVLLCVAVFAGCRKNTGEINNGQDDIIEATATPKPTATPTPTPMPTPTPIPFVQQAYETHGRDDVYLVPIEQAGENQARIATICSGEYLLNWYSVWGEEEDAMASNVLILMSPGISTDQYKAAPEYSFNQPYVLRDGTVILTEYENGMVHVLDSTLTEITSFVPGGEGEQIPNTVGVTDDGTIWTTCEGSAKLCAYDLTGEAKGEYAYDDQLLVTSYLGRQDGRECFYTVTTGEVYLNGYMYLSAETGETEYRERKETDLGDAWDRSSSLPTGGWIMNWSESTWFLHKPGYGLEGITFPKVDRDEGMNFLEGNILCSCAGHWINGVDEGRDYRIYDLEKRTVSGILKESEIPDCSFLSAQGMIGDDYVLLLALHEETGEDLLLWAPGKERSPIGGFCDFAKDDPDEYMAERLEILKNEYGIEVTPDAPSEDNDTLGEKMVGIEYINTLILAAAADPDLFRTASGEPARPENMSNNDGAHYEFNPHVFSKYYLMEHGEDRRDAFYRYVDALRAGEDSFECPNIGAASWASGRLATYFFPVGAVYCYAEYDGNGRANITYTIPKEEFLEKEREFEKMVTDIVNDVVEEDYTDLEKALALYEFMTEYCVYDYEMLYNISDWMDRQSGYRVLIEKQGICWEIACIYRYLLLQCGVDSEEITGAPLDDGDLHEWNYIELDGVGYLIDATWGLTDSRKPDLTYFLFTDALRRDRDGFDPESFDLAGYGLYGARKVYGFKAEDERYSEIWKGTYVAFDENEKCIFYMDTDGVMHRFDYGNLSEVTE